MKQGNGKRRYGETKELKQGKSVVAGRNNNLTAKRTSKRMVRMRKTSSLKMLVSPIPGYSILCSKRFFTISMPNFLTHTPLCAF